MIRGRQEEPEPTPKVRFKDGSIKQEAIPWCRTHDSKIHSEDGKWIDVTPNCLISLGPPDHYWWMDVVDMAVPGRSRGD